MTRSFEPTAPIENIEIELNQAVISQGLTSEHYEQAAADLASARHEVDLSNIRVVSVLGEAAVSKRNEAIGLDERVRLCHGDALGGVVLASALSDRSFISRHPIAGRVFYRALCNGSFSKVEHRVALVEQDFEMLGSHIGASAAHDPNFRGYTVAVLPVQRKDWKPKQQEQINATSMLDYQKAA